MDDRLFNSGKASSDSFADFGEFPILQNMWSSSAWLAAAACLIVAVPVQGATVYRQASTSVASASTINSNALANADGSDQDVTAYDDFTLVKSASIARLTWRGSSSNKGLAGFRIKIFASDAAGLPYTTAPLAEIGVAGNAGEKSAGKALSDYQADFSQPLALTAGVRYWISIVSDRNDLSPWGWANGTGGNGKSIQYFPELRVLPAPNDRAFSLIDANER